MIETIINRKSIYGNQSKFREKDHCFNNCTYLISKSMAATIVYMVHLLMNVDKCSLKDKNIKHKTHANKLRNLEMAGIFAGKIQIGQ